MYEFPYGAGQQLNLNWIINEIITLHKQLDPDWDLPNFDTAFPYTNLNTLNLDWILRELKAIKDLAPTEDAQLLKMVANALIANTYGATTQYNVDDIVYKDSDNRLYKCITATPAGGEPFDSNKWVEVDVGGVLTDLLTSQTTPVEPYDGNPAMDGTASAGTSTQYARGDHVHPKDTARVPTSRTVNGKALSSNITLNASDIPNDSNVTGDNVDDALNNCVTNVRYNAGFLKKTINGADTNIIQIQDTPTDDSTKLPSSKAVYNVNAALNTPPLTLIPTLNTAIAARGNAKIVYSTITHVANIVGRADNYYNGQFNALSIGTIFNIPEGVRPTGNEIFAATFVMMDGTCATYEINANAAGQINNNYSSTVRSVMFAGSYQFQ